MNGKRLYTKEEAADILGVSRQTIYNWVTTGKLGFEKYGDTFIITIEHIERRKAELEFQRMAKNINIVETKDLTAVLRSLGHNVRAVAQ